MSIVYMKMKWAEKPDECHMNTLDGFTRQEVLDCEFVYEVFANLYKTKAKKYKVTVEEL